MLTPYHQALNNITLKQVFKCFWFREEWCEYLGKEGDYHKLKGKRSKLTWSLNERDFINLITEIIFDN